MEPQIARNIVDLLTLSGGQCIQVRRTSKMTNRFLISVAAAALIAGTGFANAQGMSREGGGAAGGAATQSAPSSGATPGTMNHDAGPAAKGAESPGMKGSDSGMKAESSDKMPSSKSAQDTKAGEKSKSMSSENDAAKGGKDMKAEGRDSKSGNMNAQTKGADSKSTTTTGNAATSATAAPPAEKRTQIVSAIKSEKIQETTNVNFNISVGTAVPASVHFHPLPARIVEIYPEWRGYDVIFVHGQYIIVRPQTREIVYIIEG
jgi:hypothetical protein